MSSPSAKSPAALKRWPVRVLPSTAMAAKAKAERKPPMKAYATLPKEDLEALVAYMQSLKK